MKTYFILLFCSTAIVTQADAAKERSFKINTALKKQIDPEAIKKIALREGGKLYMLDGDVKRRLMPGRAPAKKQEQQKARNKRIQSLVYKEDDEHGPADPMAIAPIPKKVKQYMGVNGKTPPRSVSHRDQMTAVADQGSRGTCGAFAIAAALEGLLGGSEKLSAEYMYWISMGRSARLVCEDSGTDMADAAAALDAGGLPNDAYWTYGRECPNVDAPDNARAHATIAPKNSYLYTRQYTGKGSWNQAATIDNPAFVEAVIAAGYNVAIAFEVAWDVAELKSGKVVDVKLNGKDPVDDTWMSCKTSEDCDSPGGFAQTCESFGGEGKCVLGSHMMLAVGYERTGDASTGGGYVLLKNSWGSANDGGGYVKLSYDYLAEYATDGLLLTGSGKVSDGDPCNEMAQCEGFNGVGKQGSGCCKTDNTIRGVCEPLVKDWAGTYYCPSECLGRAGATPGTCPLADNGDDCKVSADCKGFTGAGQPGSACCGGVCQALQKDFANVFYCPAECVGKAGGKAGSCSVGKAKGESCRVHADCAGFDGLGKDGSGCCNGKCAPFKRDHAGVYYCKDECVGAAGASRGTCPLKGKNDACKVSADCAGGRTCCSGKCKAKQTDWAGVKYCPEACVGSLGGKAGSCD